MCLVKVHLGILNYYFLVFSNSNNVVNGIFFLFSLGIEIMLLESIVFVGR